MKKYSYFYRSLEWFRMLCPEVQWIFDIFNGRSCTSENLYTWTKRKRYISTVIIYLGSLSPKVKKDIIKLTHDFDLPIIISIIHIYSRRKMQKLRTIEIYLVFNHLWHLTVNNKHFGCLLGPFVWPSVRLFVCLSAVCYDPFSQEWVNISCWN